MCPSHICHPQAQSKLQRTVMGQTLQHSFMDSYLGNTSADVVLEKTKGAVRAGQREVAANSMGWH